MALRVAAAQLNTVVGDLPGNVDRILAALAGGRGGRRRPLRGARAGHPRLPARGPPPQARLRGRQPGRAGEGGRRHAAVRRRGRLRRRHPGRPGWPTPPPSVPVGGWSGSTTSASSPTTASSTSSAGSSPSDETPTLFGVAGAWVGISICEDVWFADGPVAEQGRAGADVVVNLNASPYYRGRRDERLAMLRRTGGRGRLRHRLRQPGRRPGRAGLRRRLAGHGARRDPAGQRRPVRNRTWSWSTSPSPGPDPPRARPEAAPAGGHRGAGPPARPAVRAAAAAPAARPTTPRSTRPWCSVPGTTWGRTASATR